MSLKRFLYLLLFCAGVSPLPLHSQGFRPPEVILSPEARISVLTMGPGKEIYLAFGHSAIRVKDPLLGLDMVFNYGTFTLEDPLFIPKFVRGELNYRLEVYPSTEYYLEIDKEYQNRIWIEQELNLTENQRQALYRFLVHNARPENRFYVYDFMRDNCSTRITDALRQVLGEEVILRSALNSPRSFRSLLDEYAQKRPFWQLLFSLAVGSSSDREMPALEEDWMPFYLLYLLDRSEIKQEGQIRPLVAKKTTLFQPTPPSDYSEPWSDPGFLLWPLAMGVLILTLRGFIGTSGSGAREKTRTQALTRWGDAGLFIFVGLAGAILFYLEFFSIHTAVKGNLNLVWANPLALGAALALGGKKSVSWKKGMFGLTALGAAGVVIFWPWWPQAMPLSMLPLQILVLTRSVARLLEGPPAPQG